MRLNAFLVSLPLLAVACGAGAQAEAPPVTEVAVDATRDEAPTPVEISDRSMAGETVAVVPAPSAGTTPSPLAAKIVELPPAGGIPEPRRVVAPVAISFEAIGVSDAPVLGVGVLDNGEMEIPGAREVGWYSYGPSPGEAGSAVLAAHIAFDGEGGVFRYLIDAKVGDEFTVAFDDGSEQRYEVIEQAQYNKNELPFDRVFSRSGDPIITLISCGGTFQRSLSSYEDNIVAYARPVE
jgi:LPXTG-site transpeptidase (sortase) family protein